VIGRERHTVWVFAAWAALLAQAAPAAFCAACDRPCCANRAEAHESTPCTPGTESPGTAFAANCPLCAAHAGFAPAEADEEPCHCQLEARQEKPAALSRIRLAGHQDDAPAIGVAAFPTLVPQSVGISREYLADSLGIPIRPARILFGVWRN
jgi:hypothetical protein